MIEFVQLHLQITTYKRELHTNVNCDYYKHQPKFPTLLLSHEDFRSLTGNMLLLSTGMLLSIGNCVEMILGKR